MKIINDKDILISHKKELIKYKDQLGDVNLRMIKMINEAETMLEGEQMELAKRTTLESTKKTKILIANIDAIIKFIDKLIIELDKYFDCKFKEI